ncbi:hypothetical protein [Aurantiacibacter spongiae]|uniref:Uncharacterized protein n=1 Tax=Aurantiacibacter spongiae TaxID=2488860 RepID=A0A3N5CPG9_9SPHN|nr:hypothetical protein [Aurantiacibacter spongiae]RPF70467.1 hypothetical protein EG799_01595 [Aurantiacibacter spongiae]
MNTMTTITPPAQEEVLLSPRAALGLCIHSLNLAAQEIERLGGEGSFVRNTVERVTPVRWSA